MSQTELSSRAPGVITSIVNAGELRLESGEKIPDLQISFECVGPADAPAVVVLGGISATRHAGSHEGDPSPGWWEPLVGPGKGLDTTQFRVVGIDFLGGNGQTSGPRNSDGWPRTVSPADQATCIARLMDQLEITRLHHFVGASYGGMVALEFARHFGERCKQAVVLGAAHRPTAMATALRCVQREAVRACSDLGDSAAGLRLSRAIGMSTYRSNREFEERFSRKPTPGQPVSFEVENYLFARGHQFASEFHPDAYLTLSTSIDLLDLEPEAVKLPVALLAFQDDFVAPPALMRELNERLGGLSTLTELPTLYGHDAFLKESIAVSQWLKNVLGNDAITE
ncbi:MAG: homoserine O-succinyltransferase [Pseudomonadota bacterium]